LHGLGDHGSYLQLKGFNSNRDHVDIIDVEVEKDGALKDCGYAFLIDVEPKE